MTCRRPSGSTPVASTSNRGFSERELSPSVTGPVRRHDDHGAVRRRRDDRYQRRGAVPDHDDQARCRSAASRSSTAATSPRRRRELEPRQPQLGGGLRPAPADDRRAGAHRLRLPAQSHGPDGSRAASRSGRSTQPRRGVLNGGLCDDHHDRGHKTSHGWRRGLRWVKRGALGLVALVVVAIVARDRVRPHRLRPRQDPRHRRTSSSRTCSSAAATIGHVEGTPFGELVLSDVVINGPDRQARDHGRRPLHASVVDLRSRQARRQARRGHRRGRRRRGQARGRRHVRDDEAAQAAREGAGEAGHQEPRAIDVEHRSRRTSTSCAPPDGRHRHAGSRRRQPRRRRDRGERRISTATARAPPGCGSPRRGASARRRSRSSRAVRDDIESTIAPHLDGQVGGVSMAAANLIAGQGAARQVAGLRRHARDRRTARPRSRRSCRGSICRVMSGSRIDREDAARGSIDSDRARRHVGRERRSGRTAVADLERST